MVRSFILVIVLNLIFVLLGVKIYTEIKKVGLRNIIENVWEGENAENN